MIIQRPHFSTERWGFLFMWRRRVDKDMEKCPVCNSPTLTTVCECGYDFKEKEVVGKNKVIEFYKSVKTTKDWLKQVKLVKNIHQVQQKKHGVSYSGKSGGWKLEKTAKLLSEQISIISDIIDLADAIDLYPDLKLSQCKNRSHALRRWKEFKAAGILYLFYKKFDSEKDLQEYLETQWDDTPLGEKWVIKESLLNTGDVGQIDILAHHRDEDRWLIIELKKDTSPDKTVGQLQRYMGWVKENLAEKDEKIEGIIISGFPPDKNVKYALSINPDIEQKIYYLKNGAMKFIKEQFLEGLLDIMKLPLGQQMERLKEIRLRKENNKCV
ncbi:MAG: DUF1016 family protein [Deltaproteobacteria bacterium]|nr:DUF1016 family protein [Deltaproteobacteria bacterium]